MAHDDILLNFVIGNDPLKPAVSFKGGSWRDRSRAKKARARTLAALRQSGRPSIDPSSIDPSSIDSSSIDPSSASAQHDHRPAKRARTSRQEGESPPPRQVTNPPASTKHIASRLFTSNPLPVTDIDAAAANSPWDAPAPSNTPAPDAPAFSALGILPRLTVELARENLSRPTPIQRAVMPHLLDSDADAFVQAETGSGKTLAYLLPILNRVLRVSSSGRNARDAGNGAGNDGDATKGGGGSRHLHRDSGLFAVVVTPTRELARQTYAVLARLLRPFPWLVATAIIGGESKKAEKARIRKGVNFLIATPGRLADHLDNTRTLSFCTVRWLVLDEGDRLMELGFEEDLRKVVTCMRRVAVSPVTRDGTVSLVPALPARRITVLCSATMQMNVQRLGEMSLADAAFLEADNRGEGGKESKHNTEGEMGGGNAQTRPGDVIAYKAPAQLRQLYIVVPAKLRLVTLVSQLRNSFIRKCPGMKIIVFMSCADSVDFHYGLLKYAPLDDAGADPHAASTASKAAYLTTVATPAVSLFRLHGSLPQSARTATLAAFASSAAPAVLLATDIASRGLDIPSVDLVVEYDPAFSVADHIHRVGRTARAGRPGEAALFLLPGCEEGYLAPLRASAAVPPAAQSYEHFLRSGLVGLDAYPFETHARPPEGSSSAGWARRAEALQLHLEQRLLGESAESGTETGSLLAAARAGFRAHVRAYATHVKDERKFFDFGQLHLGHLAKSFGLREAPAGIGMGLGRKTNGKGGKGTKDGSRGLRGGEKRTADGTVLEVDASGIQAGKEAVMNKVRTMGGADEFNLG